MLRLRNYNGTDIGFASDRSYYLNELSVRIFLLMCSHTIPGDGMVIYHERYSDGPLVSVGAPVQSESALSIATVFLAKRQNSQKFDYEEIIDLVLFPLEPFEEFDFSGIDRRSIKFFRRI